jgi:hemoglobin-like flavoprotein
MPTATAATVQNLSFTSIATVMDSWELARQKHACAEEIGSEILFCLFRLEPNTKCVFGFTANQAIETNPLLRMGVLVHATRIVAMLDSILSLLDMVQEVLGGLGERHKRHGVQKEFFVLLVDALCLALHDILGDAWTDATRQAWREVFGDMAAVIAESM